MEQQVLIGRSTPSAARRRANSKRNDEEYRERTTTLESRPRMVFVELTRGCNLMCPMCRPAMISGREWMMPDDVLKTVRTELFSYAECVDLRGWGESTLDNRLLPLTDELLADGVKVRLVTNLVTRRPGYWRSIGERPIHLWISVEAAEKELYEEIRLGGRHDHFLANLAALANARRASGNGATITFSVVLSEANLAQLPALVRLAARHGIPTIKLNPLSTRELRDGAFYPITGFPKSWHDRLGETLVEASAVAADLGVSLEQAADLRSCGDGGFDLCTHPWAYVFVRYDGAVGFCDHLVAHETSMLGDLREQSFMEIWNGPKYVAVRDEHVRKDLDRLAGLGLECDWCYANRLADSEELIDPALRSPLVSSQWPQYASPSSS